MNRPRSKRQKRPTTASPPVAPIADALPRLPWWILVILAVAAAAAFGPAIRAPFQFDDIGAIPQNPSIRRLWPPSVPLDPPPGQPVSGRPVVNYSFALNYALNGALGVQQAPSPAGPSQTIGYHVVNILIHVISGFLLLGILRRTLQYENARDRLYSFAAAAVVLVWLIHPIQTEAVNYVTQRTELLVSAFYLGTLYASIRAWDAPTPRSRLLWNGVAVIACLLGMGSKEVMVTAPLAVVLYDRAFRHTTWRELRSTRRDRLWLYAALCLTWIPLVVSVVGNARGGTVGFSHGVTWYQYFFTQLWAVSHYLRLILWPAGLTYDYGARPIHGVAPIVGAVLLGVLAIATIVTWRRSPKLGFVGVWFFLLLAPSSSVVPIHTEIAAERRVYLAFAAIPIAIAIALEALRRRGRLSDTAFRRSVPLIVAGIVIGLVAVSARRGTLFNNPEALWRDAIAKRPDNPRAYDNLAAVIFAKNPAQVGDAEGLWRRAIAIDSTYIPAWTNLSQIEVERQRFTEARDLLERAVRINPDAVDASQRLGGVLVKLGDPKRAIPLLERTTAVSPNDDALATLAMAYMAVDRPDDAITALRHAVSLNPRRLDAVTYLGALLAERGQLDEAVRYLEIAGGDPGASATTLSILSLTEAQLGRPNDAVAAARRAIGRPDADATVYLQLGRAMMLLQRVDDADQFLTRAVQLDPANLEAITRLGIAKAAGGRASDAERLFRRALQLQPDYAPARNALAKLLESR